MQYECVGVVLSFVMNTIPEGHWPLRPSADVKSEHEAMLTRLIVMAERRRLENDTGGNHELHRHKSAGNKPQSHESRMSTKRSEMIVVQHQHCDSDLSATSP